MHINTQTQNYDSTGGPGLRIGPNPSQGVPIRELRVYDLQNQDFPSIPTLDEGNFTFTCPGVALGDVVMAIAPNVNLGVDVLITGHVAAADQVRCVIRNGTGGALDLAGTVDWKIVILKTQ